MRNSFFVLICVLIFALTHAQQPEPAPSPQAVEAYQNYIEIGIIIAAIVFGLLWVFFGYRLIAVVLFIAGFVIFFFILLSVLEAKAPPPTLAIWLHYVIAAGAGLVGGLLFVCLKKIGFFLFGFLLGVMFSAIIIGATPLVNLFTSGLIPLIIILVSGLVVGIATIFLSRPLLIIGTAFNGSYLIGVTLDYKFLHTSVSDLFLHIISNFSNALQFTGDWKPYVVLAGIFVFALIGMFVQFKFTANNFHYNDKQKIEDEQLLLLAKV